ncbi:putative base-plate wedget subunit protein [Erwinia phage vB_EamM_Yoloswag]|uniref:Putative base-plate wedget subunit protein n=1 Tax=Erwinia phage vB_EamM_Yoloswag TaxID=1958956 RepID=A0A1S6L328_9CAUD|nr:putative base-plate wedget subunit protein [Erwinia phage vB_EamM_Yoloswag]AQT28587.1 putative base-plate wedget subunit protein [Erwinia phage vB_EamM_Yoloswag]
MGNLLSTMTTHEEFASEFLTRINANSYWTDAQVSSITSLIADALGDIGVSNSYACLIAAREAFIRLARRDTSILAGARFLGVDIGRKSAGAFTAQIINQSAVKVTMDKHEPFQVNGVDCLLAEVTQWAAGETKAVNFVVGDLFTFSQLVTTTADYTSVLLGSSDFQLTDDITVWIEDTRGNKTTYDRFDKTLFEAYAGQRIYLVNTTDSGDVELLFGGEQWGTALPAGYTLKVRAVRSQGATVNTDAVGLKVTSNNNSSILGKTSTSITGASDETDLSYYRNFAPIVGRSRRRLIREDEWHAGIMLYPDVADCVVQGQRDIAPNDKEWMGVVRVCVLPKNTSTWGGVNPNPSSAQWTKFLNWLSDFRSNLDVQTYNPTKLLIDCVINVYLYQDAPGTKQSNEDSLTAAVSALFERRRGLLGQRLALSDIMDRVKYDYTDPDQPTKRPEVDYVSIPSPLQDVIPNSKTEYVALRTIRVVVSYSERKMQ